MVFDKSDQVRDNRLDRAGSAVVRAAGLRKSESDACASSPFLYARVRARIDDEQRRMERSVPALAMLSIAWRAIPAVGLVALVAVSAWWVTTPASPGDLSAFEQADNVKLIAAGGTCALSNDSECAISREEVLATMFREEEATEK